MEKSKLITLLSRLEELSVEGLTTKNDFFIESLNDELSRNLKGGMNKPAVNNNCSGSTNVSCINNNCHGTYNVVCQNN
ncbi:hypothetical protein HDF18_16910 [Mucilaginibacter sp. X5P1]|uniref:hypothetical protein n=1 Tax=Mucilaginibacter sp. X5P1 TaxID=2723088 RepID=UPI001611DDD5|nr:hypothetical protein [Mucilaginibacter sp. X5P1]MBB6139316.1 hypothetical protein [Mucilaginibacter sp. X5P1]